MMSSPLKLLFRCFAGDSISFTWSAAGPAVIFASLSMLLILFSATRLRDNPDYQLHIQQIRLVKKSETEKSPIRLFSAFAR